MANWNPSAPVVIGTEYLPTARTAAVFQSGLSAPGQVIVSSVAETVDSLNAGTTLAGGGRVMADVYVGASVPAPGARTTRSYAPTGNNVPGGWTDYAGGTTDLWSPLGDDPATATVLSAGIRDPNLALYDAVQFKVGSGAFPASRRVTDVRVRARVIGGDIEFSFVRGGVAYAANRIGYTGAASPLRLVDVSWGELCPWTGKPWTQVDVVELSTGVATLQVRRADLSSGYLIPQIEALRVVVVDVAENRAAFAVGPYADPSILTAYTPAAGGSATAGWAKANATTYTVVIRPATSGTLIAAGLRQTTGLDDLPPGAPAATTVTMSGTFPDTLPVSSRVKSTTTSLALILTVAGATSVDSNPWVDRADYIDLSNGDNRQQFTPSVSGAYGIIRAAVRVPAGGSLTRLRLRIRRVSDNAVIGGEGQLTREQALAGQDLGNGYRLARVQLGTTAALVGGTAYYVDLSLVSGTDPWRVGLLITSIGATDQFQVATVNGGAGINFADAVWEVQVAQLPATLTGTVGLTAATIPVLPPAAPDFTPCADDGTGVPSARVSWATTSLGGSFAAYEVQRSDERDRTWRTVAYLTTSTTTEVYDHEVRLGGIASRYRVRQVRNDGVASDWIASAEVKFSAPADCRAGMVWSSNVSPERLVIAPDLYDSAPVRDYKFQEAKDLTTQAIYGRDGLVAFRPLERRGVTFSRSVVVDALVGTRPRGETVFDTMRALCSARDLPYVCVRDDYGDRWFAAVNITEGQVKQPFDRHVAAVEVIELTETPQIVTRWNGLLGSPWIALAGTWGVDSTSGTARLMAADPAQAAQIVATPTPFADSGGARVVMVPGATPAAPIGLAAKIVDGQNYIAIESSPAFAAVEFVKVVGGARTNLSSNWIGGGGDAFELRWYGRSSTGGLQVAALEGGVLKALVSIADPVFDGANMAGLVCEGPSAGSSDRWEGFEAFDLTETPGPAWTVVSGIWRADRSVLSCYANDIAKPGQNLVIANSGKADAQLHWTVVTASDSHRLVFRYVDSQNYLFFQCSATFGGWSLGKRVAGVETSIRSYPLTANTGDMVVQVWANLLRFRCAGAWLDQGGTTTLTLPGDVAAFQTSGVHGFQAADNRGAGLYTGRIGAFQVDAMTHLGVAGSALGRGGTGSAVDTIRNLPASPLGLGAGDVYVGVWGINDAIPGAGAQTIRAWQEATRSVLSRVLRLTDTVDTAGSITYTGTWSTVADTTQGSGVGYRRATTVGASLSFPAAGSSDRGPVALTFLASNSTVGAGGSADIKVDGITVDTVDTRLWGTGDTFSTPITRRVRLAPGAHTVSVVVTSLDAGGRVAFDGWGYEAANTDQAPTMILANVAVLTLSPDFHDADRFGPSMIGDSNASWATDAYVGRTVAIYSGTGSGQTRTVTSNSATEVTTDTPWATLPDASSDFLIQFPSFWGWINRDTVAAYNAAQAAVVAEFPRAWTRIVDIDSILAERPTMFEGNGAGGLHPNDQGHRAIGQAIAEAVPGGRASRLVIAGHSYSVAFGATTGHGLDDVIRRLVLAPAFADGFDRPPVARYRDSFDR